MKRLRKAFKIALKSGKENIKSIIQHAINGAHFNRHIPNESGCHMCKSCDTSLFEHRLLQVRVSSLSWSQELEWRPPQMRPVVFP